MAGQQRPHISRPTGPRGLCRGLVRSVSPAEEPGPMSKRGGWQACPVTQPKPVYRCLQCRQDFDREDRVRAHQIAAAQQIAAGQFRRRHAYHTQNMVYKGVNHLSTMHIMHVLWLTCSILAQHAFFNTDTQFCVSKYACHNLLVCFFWPPQRVHLAELERSRHVSRRQQGGFHARR